MHPITDADPVDTPDHGLAALRSPLAKALSAADRVLKLARLERGDLLIVFIYAVTAGLCSLVVPITVQSLVNTVAFTARMQPLLVLTVFVLAGLSITGVLNTLQYQVVETLNQRLFVRTTRDAVRRLVESDLARTRPHAAAQLLNKFLDVALVQKAGSTLLLDGLSVTLQGLVALLLLGFYHPALLAFDAILVALIAIILFVLGRGGTATSIKESKAKHHVVASLQEVARAGSVFKSRAGIDFALQRADELARDYVFARKKHFRVVFRQAAASYALQALATASLLGLGGKLVLDGQLTLGQLVAAELAVTALLSSVAKLGKYLESYYDLVASLDKVGEIVDLPAEPTSGSRRRAVHGPAKLLLQQVGYRHDSGTVQLAPVSLGVDPGQLVAVLGGDASGKSTLSEIIYGIRRPTSGQLFIDDANLTELQLADLRKDVALVGTDLPFSGNLRDNLAFGDERLDPVQVARVLAIVGLTQDIETLAQGAMTTIGPNGVHLTGSQAARLALARGILAKPRLLLLDGTLDRLEQPAAISILQAIRQFSVESSVVVLTVDPVIASACDTVTSLNQNPNERQG
jgi:putative ABC transport system ATP-binding protein